jgi:hypothetical protein
VSESEETLAREDVFRMIRNERGRQDKEWGGSDHDDTHCVADWLEFIEKQIGQTYRSRNPNDDRKRFVKIAALATAAVESLDRQYPE